MGEGVVGRQGAARSLGRTAALLAPPLLVGLVLLVFPQDGSGSSLAPPSLRHPAGTDLLGHDMVTLTLRATFVTVLEAAAAYVLGAAVATAVAGAAALAGRGAMREAGRGLHAAFTAIPPVLGAIVLLRLVPSGHVSMILVLSMVSWPRLFKALDSTVLEGLARRGRLAAMAAGVSRLRFLGSYLGPGIRATVLDLAPLEIVELVALHGTLGFLGVGASDPALSLGRLVADGRAFIQTAPWLFWMPVGTLAAVLAMYVAVAARYGEEVSGRWLQP